MRRQMAMLAAAVASTLFACRPRWFWAPAISATRSPNWSDWPTAPAIQVAADLELGRPLDDLPGTESATSRARCDPWAGRSASGAAATPARDKPGLLPAPRRSGGPEWASSGHRGAAADSPIRRGPRAPEAARHTTRGRRRRSSRCAAGRPGSWLQTRTIQRYGRLANTLTMPDDLIGEHRQGAAYQSHRAIGL